MPIYEYECTKCGNRIEVIQGFSDPPITDCNTCSGKVKKVISSPAIVFKGSGWYVSDYSDKFKDKNKGDAKKPAPEVKADAKGNTNSEANTGGGAGGTEKPAETKQASPSSQPDK
ncbi:MAG TPA: FmdB family zinc ribbon protein [Nitrospiria bacterium]|nr:FmdB family zinc ribbon protein [Nitrospiria bacterium]